MLELLPLLLQAAPVASASLSNITATLNTTAAIVNPSSIDAGLAVFVEETLAVVILLLMVLAISLQLARGYFLRILKKFTLRLTADLWWLIYILLRDLTVFLVLFLGLILFLPSADLTFGVAVPFMPLGIDLYAIALVIILVKNSDEESKYDTLVTTILALGTALYMIGTIGVTETPLALAVIPGTVSAASSNPWGFFNNYFSSIRNPALEMYSFYITFIILAACGLYAIMWSLKQGEKKPATVPNPAARLTMAPTPGPQAPQPKPAMAMQPAPQMAQTGQPKPQIAPAPGTAIPKPPIM
jgi:hypothetical protein